AVPGLAIAIACYLDDLAARPTARAAGLTALLGAGVWAIVTLDLTAAKNAAQHFIWLFSYDYINTPRGRPWPDALDFRPGLIAFGAASSVAAALLVARARWRWVGVGALSAVAIVLT